MDETLKTAALNGDIDALYALIAKNSNLLELIDAMPPFEDTPLHLAAYAGRTHFALEIASLKPSYCRKLNKEGLSPLHLALQKGHDGTAKSLIKIDSELIRVKGKGRITPLHYIVAETEKIHLLADFLCVCPTAIEDLTIQCETAVHIAVRKKKLEIFKVLLGWLYDAKKEEILSWKDEKGNTAWHIAALTNQPKVMRILLDKAVNTNERNYEDLTALDLVSRLPSELDTTEVRDILRHPPRGFRMYVFLFTRRLSDDMRDVMMVVAVLIATATFQAVLSPPGGLRQGENSPPIFNITLPAIFNSTTHMINTTTVAVTSTTTPDNDSNFAGTAVMSTVPFISYYILNTAAFTASVYMIFLALPLQPNSLMMHIAAFFMWFSYMVSLFLISPPGKVVRPLVTFAVVSSAYLLANSMFVLGYYVHKRSRKIRLI